MKFYHPQVQLVRERILDEPDQFVLHAVTFCPKTNLKANGHALQAGDNAVDVSLFITEDPDLPDFDFITPVVHTIRLGSFSSGRSEGEFRVSVVVQKSAISRGMMAEDKPKAQTTVSSTSAAEDDKPV
jgi:hypothetical protein